MRRVLVGLLLVAALAGCRETVRLQVKVRTQDAGQTRAPVRTSSAAPGAPSDPGAPR